MFTVLTGGAGDKVKNKPIESVDYLADRKKQKPNGARGDVWSCVCVVVCAAALLTQKLINILPF